MKPNQQADRAQQPPDNEAAKPPQRKPAAPKPAGGPPFRLDDPCPQPGCSGRMRVLSQQRTETHRIRYLVCSNCGRVPPNNRDVSPVRSHSVRRVRR